MVQRAPLVVGACQSIKTSTMMFMVNSIWWEFDLLGHEVNISSKEASIGNDCVLSQRLHLIEMIILKETWGITGVDSFKIYPEANPSSWDRLVESNVSKIYFFSHTSCIVSQTLVLETSEDPGSLKAMCPSGPIPPMNSSIPPAWDEDNWAQS